MSTSFFLNGAPVVSHSPANTTLLAVLRNEFLLTGVKRGCDTGECGACTVLVNDENVNSCMILLGEVHGKHIITIEGLAADGQLDFVQRAFAEKGAVQCGYCTPGMILSVKGLLHRHPDPTREQIRRALDGNLCRCTGYEQIFEAVEYAVAWRKQHE